MSDVGSADRVLLVEIPAEAAFLWSPDGQSLAVAHSDLPDGLVYGGVTLFSSDGDRRTVGIDDTVLAFFWSPDGARLAYVTFSETRGVLRWMVLDVRDGTRWPVVDFEPSGPQFTLFRFFDQFAYSHSPWSPDSRSLVFAGRLADDAVEASLGRQPSPHIIVVDAGRNPSAQTIADGFLAVWSPR
jgi:TolB protein